MTGMLPTEMPVLTRPPIVLRAFRGEDAGLIRSVAGDALIPLITTVPASGDASDARAYIERSMNVLPPGLATRSRSPTRSPAKRWGRRGFG
jgi:ribosomal-protein-alanine N-acetyltransferase